MSNRKIGVAMDFSAGSKNALNWALENILRKDDTLFIIHIHQSEANESRNQLWSSTGSPLIPLDEIRDSQIMHNYGLNFDHEVLEVLEKSSKQTDIKVILKIYWGDAREKLCDAVTEFDLNCLVMGSRGLGQIQRILLGSVTNHVTTNANCPVLIVKEPIK
ncbi:universal stress protein PHOS32-like [Impatiens glandulifera]|uniref:universal stress protein PHOS32-like n=1 Tax=Impatiens glandulifera TaxID=253017 RepID=UPI001FB0868F|nr:universal stress protein PHOS32-like [Impatiens glandulifera]